jgi:hypothetical protein
MTKATTTVRVYPDDAKRLEALRQWLQEFTGGKDQSLADAVKAAVDAWEREPA